MTRLDDNIDAARDTAQQMVTALLHGERDISADIADEYPYPEVLVLVLADLVAYVHERWTIAVGGSTKDRNIGWAALMADTEEWRGRS